MSRPKLAKRGSEIRDASQDTARLSDPKRQRIASADTADPMKVAGSAVSGFLKMVTLLILVLFSMYLIVSATLMTANYGDAGMNWVARSTFVGGEPASGDFAYVTSEENPNSSILDRVLQGFIPLPDASVVEIIAGPAGKVSNVKDGTITFNGKDTQHAFPIENRKLSGEYLAVCIDGACDPGEQILINHENLVGEAKGKLSFIGLEEYSSPIGEPAPLSSDADADPVEEE